MRTTTAQVTIGRVTTRKGARTHLDINGRAHCGAGRGIIDPATRWVADATVDPAVVCRRCIKALRAALAAQPADDIAAAGAALYLQTPEQATAHDAALAADLRGFHAHLAATRHQPSLAERQGITGDAYRRQLLAELTTAPLPAGFTQADLIAA